MSECVCMLGLSPLIARLGVLDTLGHRTTGLGTFIHGKLLRGVSLNILRNFLLTNARNYIKTIKVFSLKQFDGFFILFRFLHYCKPLI